MSEKQWQEIAEGTGVYENVYRCGIFKSRSVALPLNPGGYLIYSPGLENFSSFAGEVSSQVELLMAANSYHHLGLKPWKAAFPRANMVADSRAIPRLERQGHKTLAPAQDIAERLPGHIQMLRPASSKMGEIWFRVTTKQGVIWIVCDAFFNLPKVPRAFLPKLVSKITDNAPGLKVSKLIKWFAVKNAKAYTHWIRDQLAQDQPFMLVVSHGDNLCGSDLPAKIEAALKRRF